MAAMMQGAALVAVSPKDMACVYGHGAGAVCCVPSSRQLVTARAMPLSSGAAFGGSWCKRGAGVAGGSRRGVRRTAVKAQIEMFSSDDFDVERFLGSQGYINVSRCTLPSSLHRRNRKKKKCFHFFAINQSARFFILWCNWATFGACGNSQFLLIIRKIFLN